MAHDADKVYPMKRAAICLLTLLALSLPRFVRAQGTDEYNGPPPYNDVDDGQMLKVASYILAPFGYALEWGLTRPLHYAATDTALKPILSGDTEIKYFGQTSNADRLPPSTFAPFVMPANPNAIESDAASATYQSPGNILPPVRQTQGYGANSYTPGGQSALH
jgi:hypothetical protein